MNFVKFMVEIRPRIASLIENIDNENKRLVFDEWLKSKYQYIDFYNRGVNLSYRLSDNLVLLIDFTTNERRIFCTNDTTATGEEKHADFIFSLKVYDETKNENIFYVNVWYNFEPVESIFYQIGDGRVRSTMTNETYSSLDDDKIILWSLEADQPILNSNLDQLIDVFKMEESNV